MVYERRVQILGPQACLLALLGPSGRPEPAHHRPHGRPTSAPACFVRGQSTSRRDTPHHQSSELHLRCSQILKTLLKVPWKFLGDQRFESIPTYWQALEWIVVRYLGIGLLVYFHGLRIRWDSLYSRPGLVQVRSLNQVILIVQVEVMDTIRKPCGGHVIRYIIQIHSKAMEAGRTFLEVSYHPSRLAWWGITKMIRCFHLFQFGDGSRKNIFEWSGYWRLKFSGGILWIQTVYTSVQDDDSFVSTEEHQIMKAGKELLFLDPKTRSSILKHVFF